MTSQQRTSGVDDGGHDHHQQPSIQAWQLQRQLHGLNLGHGEQASTVSFADMPQSWFLLLLREHLTSRQRLALFRACKSLAVAVTRSWSELVVILRPDRRQSRASLQAALQLAATCSNIHLVLHSWCPDISLDVPAVWPCIKQLTLDEMPLGDEVIAALHLQQLSQLHTVALDLVRTCFEPTLVNTAALQRVVQAGGLPALRHLQCCPGMDSIDTMTVLEQLGSVLGHQVTELTLTNRPAEMVLNRWPALEGLHISLGAAGHFSGILTLLLQRGLRQLTVPARAFEVDKGIDRNMACAVEQLELLGEDVSTAVLAKLPMHGIHHVVMPGHITNRHHMAAEAAANLTRCNMVTVVPVPWSSKPHSMRSGSVPSSLPTLVVASSPELLQWLTQTCAGFCGAVVIDNSESARMFDAADFHSLQRLPGGVHTLALYYGVLAPAYHWAHFMGNVPHHVSYVQLWRFDTTMEDLQAMFDYPPPAGLKTLHLAPVWKQPWLGDEHANVIAAVASEKWPHVALEGDLRGQWYSNTSLSDFFRTGQRYHGAGFGDYGLAARAHGLR